MIFWNSLITPSKQGGQFENIYSETTNIVFIQLETLLNYVSCESGNPNTSGGEYKRFYIQLRV